MPCWLAGLLITCLTIVGAAEEPRVVVISPHNSSICSEFGAGFRRWHEEQYHETATVEWRNLGGTADALKFVQSEYTTKPDSIGIDCFFGGGPEPYLLLAERGLTYPYRLPREILDRIPQNANGVEIYDAQFRWYGAALSSFGILQNTRVQRLLNLPLARRWEDLADPRLLGWVGAGDPRNSGTMNNMFEAFLQAYGWERGWQVLTEIGGNVNKFDRLSSTTAKDVTLGDIAYGFAIDFYGFTQIAAAGRTNMTFLLPEDFTAISPDGLCILKGAPHLEMARRFVAFVMGEHGQRLWFLPKGHPQGAQQYSIERMSVWPEFYRRYRDVSNIAFSPFELNQSFRYNSRTARERREVVAALAGALLVDTHTELRAAWKALRRRGLPLAERQALGRVPLTESEARELAGVPWRDPSVRNRRKLAWQEYAQMKYRRLVRPPSESTTNTGTHAVVGPHIPPPGRPAAP